MTATQNTRSHSHHGQHCSHAAHGLTERGALGYLYWPLAIVSIISVSDLGIVAQTIASWF